MKTKSLTIVFLSLLMGALQPVNAQLQDAACQTVAQLMADGDYVTAAKQCEDHRQTLSRDRHQMDVLMMEAECSYMLDDYRTLNACCQQYGSLLVEPGLQLGDEAEVYQAYYYKMLGDLMYSQAEETLTETDFVRKYYAKALKIFERRHRDEDAMVIHRELAQLAYKGKDYQTADRELQTVLTYYEKRLDLGITDDASDYYLTLSQLAICDARRATTTDLRNAEPLFRQALERIDEVLTWQRSHQNRGYAESLRKKAKILMMQGDALGRDQRSLALKCYEQYVALQRSQMGTRLQTMTETQREQNWLAMHRFLYDCYRLTDQSPSMLYDLALFSKGYLVDFKHHPQGCQTTWKQVSRSLAANECALEFVQYFGKNDVMRLGCMVVRRGSKQPEFIDIAAVDTLLSWELHGYLPVQRALTSTVNNFKDELYTDSLYWQAIWTPRLMQAIGKSKKVYFAPDGMLHQLAIEYMMPDTTVTCYRLSSTRKLLERTRLTDFSRMLLVGGIDYNADISPHASDNDVEAYRFLVRKEPYLPALPGAKMEVDSISSVRQTPSDKVLEGQVATDEYFRQVTGERFPVIHLATHGFFGGTLSVGTDLKPSLRDHTMSESGLCFAGANSTLYDEEFDAHYSDGILSAQECSRLNLQDVQLMVLSACQTGLGYITADGVYGVQRGLKQAGVQSMVVSLWSVNDRSSYLLMKFFYEALQQQRVKDVRQAFEQARRRLQTEPLPSAGFLPSLLHQGSRPTTFNKPQFTHAYVLIDVM